MVSFYVNFFSTLSLPRLESDPQIEKESDWLSLERVE